MLYSRFGGALFLRRGGQDDFVFGCRTKVGARKKYATYGISRTSLREDICGRLGLRMLLESRGFCWGKKGHFRTTWGKRIEFRWDILCEFNGFEI